MVTHVPIHPYHFFVVVNAVRGCPAATCHGQVANHQHILPVLVEEADASNANYVFFVFKDVDTYLSNLFLLSDYSIAKLLAFLCVEKWRMDVARKMQLYSC